MKDASTLDRIADLNRTIGIRLAAIMASKNISREKVAGAIDASTYRLARFENGTSEMTAAQLVLAAQALGVTSSIITGEQPFQAGERGGAT